MSEKKNYIGSASLASSNSVLTRAQHPLDVRAAVDNVEDLYKYSTWVSNDKTYIYNGMVVAIKNQSSSKNLYILQNYKASDDFSPANTGAIDDSWLSDPKYWREVITNEHVVSSVRLFKGKYGYAPGVDEPDYYEPGYADYDEIKKDETRQTPALETIYQEIDIKDADEVIKKVYADMSIAGVHKSFSVILNDGSSKQTVTKTDGSEEKILILQGHGSLIASQNEISGYENTGQVDLGLQWKDCSVAPTEIYIKYNLGKVELKGSLATAIEHFGLCTSDVSGYKFINYFTQDLGEITTSKTYNKISEYHTDLDVAQIMFDSSAIISKLKYLTVHQGSYTYDKDSDEPYSIYAHVFNRIGEDEKSYQRGTYLGASSNYFNLSDKDLDCQFEFENMTIKGGCYILFSKSATQPKEADFITMRLNCYKDTSESKPVIYTNSSASTPIAFTKCTNFLPVMTLEANTSDVGEEGLANVLNISSIPIEYFEKDFNVDTSKFTDDQYWTFRIIERKSSGDRYIVGGPNGSSQVYENCWRANSPIPTLDQRVYLVLKSGATYEIELNAPTYPTVLTATLSTVLT